MIVSILPLLNCLNQPLHYFHSMTAYYQLRKSLSISTILVFLLCIPSRSTTILYIVQEMSIPNASLLHLFNQSWTTKSVLAAWKVGVVHLNFCPIALIYCLGKLYTNIIKHRQHNFMVTNNYLNFQVQKAFANNVPGCVEHHQKLLSVFADANAKYQSFTLLARPSKCLWQCSPQVNPIFSSSLPCSISSITGCCF